MALALVELDESRSFDWRQIPTHFVIALAPHSRDPRGVVIDLRKEQAPRPIPVDRYIVLCTLPLATEAYDPADRINARLTSGAVSSLPLRDELDRFLSRARDEDLDLMARRELRLRGSLLIAMAAEASSAGSDSASASRDRRTLEQLTAHIDTHLAGSLKIEDLCRATRLSQGQLSRLFADHYGTTPAAYVLGRRLDVARSLVEQQHASLVEIAFATGFSSQAHFTAAFKARWSTTPGRLQKPPSPQTSSPPSEKVSLGA
ncbi:MULTISPECIES: helix-turn-helix domain-containing protein [unclassified Brevundimonas]|uniref:helix-turn-helix domain-containing protein n=1 Tax=unclassified Brevundimonas TaxID=2622653 RepID=UPI000CFC6873|nr:MULTISPECIES: helix-turn-helix transcriptional regulator [unclassified Brevundimonas]PRA27627.1 hypothetical protein CQ024_11090 [Brevundimonas sp. MYb27]PQZ84420.1 hypothetical protein CQ026_01045 [Brevundimonas sp. MYb31]PRB17653.1 hypothetical protein CQ039_01040 [Brevundimonas sp. MYb52]PRB38026.1 hypothetical protein CQ035_01045 [Brevundimonas sp. MYb46]PRB41984.1 hypothetical protein CQ028_15085 [Brevundimonas sp. MYb33]